MRVLAIQSAAAGILRNVTYAIDRHHIPSTETREGWPLTAETEVNGDLKSTNERVHWACRASKGDFCSALAALVSPVQNIFFPHCTLFQFLFVSITQQAR
jgi:hypothetical protein